MNEEVQPAPASHMRRCQGEQSEHFDKLIERGSSLGDPKRLRQHHR